MRPSQQEHRQQQREQRQSANVRPQKDRVFGTEEHLSVTQAMVSGGQHCHPGYRRSQLRRRPASVVDVENLRRNHNPAMRAPQQLQQRHRRYCWSARGILACYCLSLAFADVGALARLGYTGTLRSAVGAVASATATTTATASATGALEKGEHEETRHHQQGEQGARKGVFHASSYLGSGMLGDDRPESRRLSELGEKAAGLNKDGRIDMDAGGKMKRRSSVGGGAGDGNENVVQER